METEKSQAQEKAQVTPGLPTYGVPHPIPLATREQQKPIVKLLMSRMPRRQMHLPKGVIRPSSIHVKHKKKGSYVT